MTDDPKIQDLKVENALLRGGLWLTTKSLKDYNESPHSEVDDDGIPKLQVTVTELIRSNAAEAITRSEKMLRA